MTHRPAAPPGGRRGPVGAKAATFGESVIRAMTRLCLEHGAVNLAQGFPDFPCPAELKVAAKAAIDADLNQYSIRRGSRSFATAPRPRSPAPIPGGGSTPSGSCASPAALPKR